MSLGCKIRKIYEVGYCLGRGKLASKSLSWQKRPFFARAFLIEHATKGLILIDTGYGSKIFAKGLYRLYEKLIPVVFDPKNSLMHQLQRDGIDQEDLSYLIISHFHIDHIGGISDFTQVPWIYRKDALTFLENLSPIKACLHGCFPPITPPIPSLSIGLESSQFSLDWHNFRALDLFSDQSLYLVDLPGHALGQIGVAMGNAFFVADALWGNFKTPPHFLGQLLQQNPAAYKTTFQKLQKLPPNIKLYSTH